jgi:hypothetical protein
MCCFKALICDDMLTQHGKLTHSGPWPPEILWGPLLLMWCYSCLSGLQHQCSTAPDLDSRFRVGQKPCGMGGFLAELTGHVQICLALTSWTRGRQDTLNGECNNSARLGPEGHCLLFQKLSSLLIWVTLSDSHRERHGCPHGAGRRTQSLLPSPVFLHT